MITLALSSGKQNIPFETCWATWDQEVAHVTTSGHFFCSLIFKYFLALLQMFGVNFKQDSLNRFNYNSYFLHFTFNLLLHITFYLVLNVSVYIPSV